MTALPSSQPTMLPRTARNMEQARAIVLARGWKAIGPRFSNLRWEYVYQDQWGIEHAHTLSRLRDLSCTSHIPHIGEKLCRLILRELFPSHNWLYNRRYDWLKEASDGSALELDIYCPVLLLACEHNGRQHLTDPFVIARDKHKVKACQDRSAGKVTLLVVEQPTYITVPTYCDLIGHALDTAGVGYDIGVLNKLKSLDGSSPYINAFIKQCYSEFTDEVLNYIKGLEGTLLKVNGHSWKQGGTLSKRSQLQIKLACGHPDITPEAGAMLTAESWCKGCAITEHKRQKFQLRLAALEPRRADYSNIGVDLSNVQRTSDGRVNIVCTHCLHPLQHRSWTFLENLQAGWCSTCDRQAQREKRLNELGWRALTTGSDDSESFQCACTAVFNATHRQFWEFDNRSECCPVARTGSTANDTPVKITLGRLGSLLRSIHPQGYLISTALTSDDHYICQCGIPGHLEFQFKQNSLTKVVARKVVDELKHHGLLESAAPKDITPAMTALVSDTGLVWDEQGNYASNAYKFLTKWKTPKLAELLQQKSGAALVDVSQYKCLHRRDYGCTACNPTGVRKKKSLSDYLQAIQTIDQAYNVGRVSVREPTVRLPDGGKLIEIQCGNADHPAFSRTLSNWGRIATGYCLGCKRGRRDMR
ncbi:hypothetical protein [Pseudomonas orientalis]|uniref:Uncharacterized protein n=1 Tax=Pseudomonas orientalis TaxID=76758 RepID=A0A1H2GKA7_9PSED|nr:hypothetical protein [Pseudomonas orientalis]KRP61597.1 hypothetical protein TU82_24150 [Pseudomonas orientalis]SDU20067.1 hypothetical protein SAMN04490197_3760 [Pseudomonas orientalis]